MAEALELISAVRERFRAAYARMLDQVLQRRLPLAVCTMTRRLAATALLTFPTSSTASYPRVIAR